MNILRRITLRDALFCTIPPLAVVLIIYISSFMEAARARQFDDWWSRPKDLRKFVGYRVRAWARAPQALAFEREIDAEAPDAASLRIDVARTIWAAMRDDPQSAFGHEFDGALLHHGGLFDVSFRVRGDTSVHWTTPKVSFTLETPRSRLYRGHRRLGFSVKEVLPQHLAARLAERMDLLAPESSVAKVFLNDRFAGVYRVLELPDEGFLRRRGRLPGNIHRGDTAERGEVFKGVERSLFLNPAIWDRTASDGSSDTAARSRMASFLRGLHDESDEGRQAFLERFDVEELGRLFAFLFLTGDPFHQSEIHNQFWFEDPSDATWHPIPWDVFVRNLERPRGAETNRLFTRLLREPEVFDATMRAVRAAIDEGVLDWSERLLDETWSANRAAFEYDLLRAGEISNVGTVADTMVLLRENVAALERRLADDAVAFGAHRDGDWVVIDFETRGNVGADLVAIALDRVPSQHAVTLVADRDRDGKPGAGDERRTVRIEKNDDGVRLVLDQPIALMAAADTRQAPFAPTPVAYRFFLDLVRAEVAAPELVRRIGGGAPSRLISLPRGAVPSIGVASHPWRTRAEPVVHVLEGDVVLERDLCVPAGDTLIIAAGTTISMAPDVSIVARGRVEAIGTEADPIRVIASEDGHPWGTFAVLGGSSEDSEFRHVEFRHGSSAVIDGIRFKGMFSLHRTRARIVDCSFRENRRSDDLVNAVHSDVSIFACLFEDANADALDLDISTGVVQGCVFRRCGNDGIDLMTASPLLLSNRLERCDDKGISIGEGSHPLVSDTTIIGAPCGIEVKDGSRPWIVRTRIEDCKVGLVQRRKNWRYGAGGFARLLRCTFIDNESDIDLDAASRLLAPNEATTPLLDVFEAALLVDRGVVGIREAKASERLRFREDFDSLTDGFEATGQVGRLEKRDDVLRLGLEDGAGTMERAVNWTLERPGLLAVEVSGTELLSLAVEVEGRSTLRRDVPSPANGAWHLVLIELPEGNYDRFRVTAEPANRRGAVSLHAVTLYDRSQR